jgi:cytochrome c oxidase assembly factor CtaG
MTEPRALSPWDLAVVVLLLALGVLYLAGTIRLRRRSGVTRRLESAAFAAGWCALMASVLPPLDALAVQLFSVHMLQHELMMLIGAPLVTFGRPLPLWLAAISGAPRNIATRALQSAPVSGGWRLLTTPVLACGLHGLAIWIWHMPRLYDAAVENEALHALQHAMFIGTSLLLWWGLLYGRYGRAGYGAAVFYLFATAVHTGILGAMLTFARVPLYDAYAVPAAARGIDALGDQQTAGLVMWVPAGLVLTLAGLAFFVAWLSASDARVSGNASSAFPPVRVGEK